MALLAGARGLTGTVRVPGGGLPIECVVVSQNEFLDSALAYFNVFFKFRNGFVFFNFFIQAIFMGENGFSKFLFCNKSFKSQNFKVIQIAF